MTPVVVHWVAFIAMLASSDWFKSGRGCCCFRIRRQIDSPAIGRHQWFQPGNCCVGGTALIAYEVQRRDKVKRSSQNLRVQVSRQKRRTRHKRTLNFFRELKLCRYTGAFDFMQQRGQLRSLVGYAAKAETLQRSAVQVAQVQTLIATGFATT